MQEMQDLISGLGRSLGEENGNPLQYSGWGNPMDRGAWCTTVHGAAKSQTWLSDSHTHTHTDTHTQGVIIFTCHSPVPFLLYLYSRVYPWRGNGLKVVLLHIELWKCHWKAQEVIQTENVNAFKAELMFNKMGCWVNTGMLRLKASLLPF